MANVTYVCGIRGSGKTTFCTNLAPNCEMRFADREDGELDYSFVDVCHGTQLYPHELTKDGDLRGYDFSEKKLYRELASIPDDATVCKISGDLVLHFTDKGDPDERMCGVRAAVDEARKHADYVVLDMYPQGPCREYEGVIALAVPSRDVEKRSKTVAWGQRTPFDHYSFASEFRRLMLSGGHVVPGEYEHRTYVWHNDRWEEPAGFVERRIQELQPWYQYFELFGIPVGPVSLIGEDKWVAIRSTLPENIEGLTMLDVGSNAGYNTYRAAECGVNVTASEFRSEYIEQFWALADMGQFSSDAVKRVRMIEGSIQSRPPDGYFDIVLMSAVHYHINRSDGEYRIASRRYGLPLLRNPLAVVLEDLLPKTGLLVLPTNEANVNHPVTKLPESGSRWVCKTLEAVGFSDIRVVQGVPQTPIVLARGGHA